jgi:hypothetical protein
MSNNDEYYEDPAPRRSLRSQQESRSLKGPDEAPVSGSKPRPEPRQSSEEAPAPRRRLTTVRRGWSAGEQAIESSSAYAQNFKPTEAVSYIKFLEEEPYAVYKRHWLKRIVGGRQQTRAYTCLDSVHDECPLCRQLGDKPQNVSAFNIALLSDDGVPVLKSWDVGARIFKQLGGYRKNFGPLTEGYYSVSKTGAGTDTLWQVIPNADPARAGFALPGPGDLAALGLYEPSIVDIPSRAQLQEIADELSDANAGKFA